MRNNNFRNKKNQKIYKINAYMN